MNRLRKCVVAGVGALSLATGAGAVAATGGDPNAGDVWVDNVGQPPGPGHEMDPHLACQDINMWADKLADSSGSYTIDGWPPSGSQEVDYSGTWSYSQSQGGDQVIAVINVQQLIANAQANGDTAAHQGFHFKLQFSQDPQKHKTFWVNCPPSTVIVIPPPPGTPPGTTPSTPPKTTTLGKLLAAHKAKHHKRKKHHKRRHHIIRHKKAVALFTG